MKILIHTPEYEDLHLLLKATPKLRRLAKSVQLAIISQIIYSPIIFVTKLSILLLFLRVFAPKQKIYIAIHMLLWANLIFYTVGLFVEIFQCSPRQKAWRPLLPGRCINQRATMLASAIFNTLSDFALLFLPIRTIWDLQMPRGQKVGVLAILGAGLL